MQRHPYAAALLGLVLTTGCARSDAERVAAPPSVVAARPAPETFAIYEVDDLHDLTAGITTMPPGVEIFHERESPGAGYFWAAKPGESFAAILGPMRTWCATLPLPEGDEILFGTSTGIDVRTYLVRRAAIVDARGVAGAMTIPLSGGGWGVALTFVPEAMQCLGVALSTPGRHFRIMVQGLVEKGPFELLDEYSRVSLAGPHGALSTTDWVCSDHRALLTISARGRIGAKAVADSLATSLPQLHDARDCRTELMNPRGLQRGK
jgi:hypothetical protein